jgi:putative addiction module CopG family antidote
MPTMNVSLTPELVAAVESRVASGLFQSSSEVVRAAIRHYIEDKPMRKTPQTLEELEADLMQAAESFDAGRSEDGRAAMARLLKSVKNERVQNA